MPTRRVVSTVLPLLCLTAALSCKPKIPEPEPAAPASAPAVAEKPTQVAVPAAPAAPREGWSEVSVDNTLPLCVFADASARESAKTIAEVKKQLLRGDRPVVFGVYSPKCVDPKCDELSTLQCSVERSGNTLRLQTKYRGFHKDGATCQGDCRHATAGCESPVLEPGEYTLEYGGTTVPLKIPSALNMPCFKRS